MKTIIGLMGLIGLMFAVGCEPMVDQSKTTNVGGNGNNVVEQSGTSNTVTIAPAPAAETNAVQEVKSEP